MLKDLQRHSAGGWEGYASSWQRFTKQVLDLAKVKNQGKRSWRPRLKIMFRETQTPQNPALQVLFAPRPPKASQGVSQGQRKPLRSRTPTQFNFDLNKEYQLPYLLIANTTTVASFQLKNATAAPFLKKRYHGLKHTTAAPVWVQTTLVLLLA